MATPVASAAEQLSSAPNQGYEIALQYRRGDADVCRAGHLLQPHTFDGGRECDVCCLAIPYESIGLSCDTCCYDVCARCAPASAVPLDLHRGFVCALAAARSGHMMSQYLAGTCYELGEGVDQSDTDAAEWCAVHAMYCCYSLFVLE